MIFYCPPVMRAKLHALARYEGEATAVILRKLIAGEIRAKESAGVSLQQPPSGCSGVGLAGHGV